MYYNFGSLLAKAETRLEAWFQRIFHCMTVFEQLVVFADTVHRRLSLHQLEVATIIAQLKQLNLVLSPCIPYPSGYLPNSVLALLTASVCVVTESIDCASAHPPAAR